MSDVDQLRHLICDWLGTRWEHLSTAVQERIDKSVTNLTAYGVRPWGSAELNEAKDVIVAMKRNGRVTFSDSLERRIKSLVGEVEYE